MTEPAWRLRPPTHLNVLALMLFSLGMFGGIAGFTGSTWMSILQFATFRFAGIAPSIPLLGLSAASIVTALASFAWGPRHLPAAACFVGWAAVSIWLSSAPPENRIFSAIVMVVAALAYIANRGGSPDRALVARPRD